MKNILEGKTILVAGAGGIGNGLAIRYAAEGANLVLGDIDLATAQQAVDEITKAGGNAVATVLDGSDEQSIVAAVALCLDKFGGIDGLHCNFACMTDGDPTVDILGLPLEIYDETMRVNAAVSISAPGRCCRTLSTAVAARYSTPAHPGPMSALQPMSLTR
jgi:NAD(P)-dependent dehydrogenase (short-subunit alcohol dehydrogenase family)